MSDDDSLLELDIEEEDADAFDPEFEEDLPDAEDPLADADADADDDEDLDEDDEENPPARNAKRPPQSEGEFEDEVDPDNVEDDLNTILRDRIAAGDDLADDDDAEEAESGQPAELLGSVTPRRVDEWLCEGCFLLVSKSQLGTRSQPRCPSGEEICPSLDRLGL